MLDGNASDRPLPAVILSPADQAFPVPSVGERFGNFTWQPSTSADVVAEVIEFAPMGDDRLFFKLRPAGGSNGQVSVGQLFSTGGPWRWRVWSISNGGGVSFSEARGFKN